MTNQLALQQPTIYDGETRLASVSFVGLLDDGELLSGTPTVTEITSSDLTFANEALNSSAKIINKKSVAANKAVVFKITGFVAGETYTIEITSGTDSSPAQTLKIKASFIVID